LVGSSGRGWASSCGTQPQAEISASSTGSHAAGDSGIRNHMSALWTRPVSFGCLTGNEARKHGINYNVGNRRVRWGEGRQEHSRQRPGPARKLGVGRRPPSRVIEDASSQHRRGARLAQVPEKLGGTHVYSCGICSTRTLTRRVVPAQRERRCICHSMVRASRSLAAGLLFRRRRRACTTLKGALAGLAACMGRKGSSAAAAPMCA